MIGVHPKRIVVTGALALAVTVLLSACGSSGTSASPGGSAPAYPPGGPRVSPSVGASGNGAAVGIQAVSGIGKVLIDGRGLTLYHLTTDSSTKTTCTGACAQVWPPLLAPNGVPPASPAPGTFATLTQPDGGLQVTLNGMPLYTYAGDSRPGQANGQGIGGTWFAVGS